MITATLSAQDFIEREILPILGEAADSFDVEDIFEDVAELSADGSGFVWKDLGEVELNDTLAAHDKGLDEVCGK